MTLLIRRSFDSESGRWNIYPEGEADIATAGIFRSALDESYQEKKGDIILDMGKLRYLDSTGLGVIIGIYNKMKENGDRITLANPPDNIKKLLRITDLCKLLCPEICES